MKEKYIMALDQGTTSSRCVIYDKLGKIKSMVQREFRQIYPKAGWVEHNPMEIWGSQAGAAAEALASAGISPDNIAAIGITNQRETCVLWDRETGIPVTNAIVWQCRRTADYCAGLKEKGFEEMISRKTGLVLDAYFSASKIRWVLGNVEGARELAEKNRLLFGTVDSWLLWNLTKGRVHATDYTNASRTMLFNIHTLGWDKELLELFGVLESILPEVKPSSCFYGMTDSSVFGAEIPVCGIAGDQQAALFGQLCIEDGTAKNTYGTGCFLLMNTGNKAFESSAGLITTLAASYGAKPQYALVQYALEGSIFVGGAVIQWLRDELGLLDHASDSEALAASVSDTSGVYVVPAFVGLGAPYWNSQARGAVFGLTRGTGKAHFVRAALESMAYQTESVIRAMEKDSGLTLKHLKVDGGASSNNFLMQFQADILNQEVIRSGIESTALGAAYLAGLKAGYWKNIEEIKELKTEEAKFAPKMDGETRERFLAGWEKAVNAALSWAE